GGRSLMSRVVPHIIFEQGAAGRWTARWLPIADPGVAPSSGHSPADAWLGASLGSGCAGMSRASTCSSFKTHHMIPAMSRPANPYDNASCESFLSGAATLQFFQPAEDGESEGAKSAKKNNRTIG